VIPAAIVATAISLLSCVALVVAEAAGSGGRQRRIRWKPLASAGFVAVGAMGIVRVHPSDHATWIVVGLVLGAIGDVLLLFRSLFLAGLVVFLLGHVAYIVGFALVVPIGLWPKLATIPAMLAVSAGGTALSWLWPHAGPLRVPVIAYVLVIVTMVIGASAVAAAAPWTRVHAGLVVAGAVMFFASDLAVARDRFVSPGFVNRLWGLPVYYVAQLLIAWSLLAV
jgi:uncharacterized membrane protein YhhN